MLQQVSQTVQEEIDELVRRTQEKKEERKKKKKALLVGETASTSQECPSRSDKGQETTTATSAAGHTISIKHINKGEESTETKKTDHELGQEKEIYVEEQEEVDIEEHGKTTDEPEGKSIDDDEPEDEPCVVQFEDPVYRLSQTYEMESKYESMTIEQEATEVWALSPIEQAKYRELTRLHQVEPTERQELHQMTEKQRIQTQIKQDEIP